MNVLLICPFRYLLITTLRLTTHLGGEQVWRVWERVTVALASVVGNITRVMRPAGERPIEGMMGLVDWADSLIGVEGDWRKADPTHAVKRIAHCPLAGQLRMVPGFCTRLGVKMGKAALRAYAPQIRVEYAIPKALSKGDLYCEYLLVIKEGEGSKAV